VNTRPDGRSGRLANRTACPLRARPDGEPRLFTVTHGQQAISPDLRLRCSVQPGPEPSKLVMRVRFPSSAPEFSQVSAAFTYYARSDITALDRRLTVKVAVMFR